MLYTECSPPYLDNCGQGMPEPLKRESGEEFFCGRGGQPCPGGYYCVIDPADRFAVCCSQAMEAEDNTPDPRATNPEGGRRPAPGGPAGPAPGVSSQSISL